MMKSADLPQGEYRNGKDLVADYFETVWNCADHGALPRFLAEDYRRYTASRAPALDADQQSARIAGLRSVFPDMRVEIQDMIQEGDLVCVRITFQCTHVGAFMDLAPTSRSINSSGIEIMRIQNGKISEHWGGPDIADMLQQIQKK